MHETIAIIRDLFIILLALVSVVVVVLMAWLLIELRGLTRLIRDEVKPILQSAQDTVSTVRGTTSFVSENVVAPFVKISSFVAGARALVDTLAGRDKKQ
ncbi:MAG: hypothetical protein LC737_04940 [Chloroflexi bacterium]|nr:hypothetical protein [Chloroflexota bacterium]